MGLTTAEVGWEEALALLGGVSWPPLAADELSLRLVRHVLRKSRSWVLYRRFTREGVGDETRCCALCVADVGGVETLEVVEGVVDINWSESEK